MIYKILFSKEAKKAINKLTSQIKEQIKDDILKIAQEPAKGKALTHELTGLFSFRSGNYRIIYEINKKEILVIVLTIGNRKHLYQQVKKIYNYLIG